MLQGDEKSRILRTAQVKFFQQGFHRVTVDELAAELGMSKKTIYKHFPTKDDLVREVVYFMRDIVVRQVKLELESDQPFERKATALFTIIGRLWGNMSRQFPADMRRYAPDLWREIETFRREQILSRISKLFREAKEEGVLRHDVDQEVFILAFLSTVEGIINPTTLSEHSFSADEAFRQILTILFSGALTEEYRRKLEALNPATIFIETPRFP